MDNFDNLQKNIEQSAFHIETRKTDLTEKQNAIAATMNKTITEDAVLTSIHTDQMTEDEMQNAYMTRYEGDLQQNQHAESNRQKSKLRKQAESKTQSAMNLHRQLNKLADDGTDYAALVADNFTLAKIKRYKPVAAKSNQPELLQANKDFAVIKKNAPRVFERGLRLAHALQSISKDKEKYPKLYDFALESFQQAQREWDHIQQMAEKSMVYNVKIDQEIQTEYLQERKNLPQEEKWVQGDFNYEVDYENNMKKKKVDWSKIEKKHDEEIGSDGVRISVKKVLFGQMELIKKEFPDAEPDDVESTVNEYLKRIAERTQFRIRLGIYNASKILNGRYHSKPGVDAYNDLIKMQYSKHTKLKAPDVLAFGSLGGDTAKEFIGYGSKEDPCAIYGNMSFKFDKEELKGKVSFVSGNSLHHYEEKFGRSAYIDEEQGIAPDITMCGTNLVSIYRRAKTLKEKNWEGMLSSEQEAGKAITDHGDYPYFECHFHGLLTAKTVSEATYILKDNSMDLTKAGDVAKLKNSEELKDLYERIKVINNNPDEYGRDGKPELKLSVWDLKGHTITYNDLKSIFG